MLMYPQQERLAWVDAGFNHYRLYRPEVSPAPWLTFWPTYGVAVRMHAKACNCRVHNVCWSRYGDHHRCMYGAFFYGSRRAIDKLARATMRIVGDYVRTRQMWGPQKLYQLCSDQVTTRARNLVQMCALT